MARVLTATDKVSIFGRIEELINASPTPPVEVTYWQIVGTIEAARNHGITPDTEVIRLDGSTDRGADPEVLRRKAEEIHEKRLDYADALCEAVLEAETVAEADRSDAHRAYAVVLRVAAGLYGLPEGVDPATRARKAAAS